MNRKTMFFTTTMLIHTTSFCFADGLYFGNTRMIYDATQKESHIPVFNNSDTLYLMQAWVTDIKGQDKNIPFIATPPLFKLGRNDNSTVRVVYTSMPDLPVDRESLFLLNIRSIPSVEKKQTPSRITISTQSILKLIYRPSGLSAEKAGIAWEKLSVIRRQNELRFKNDTPYIITLANMTVDGKTIKEPGYVLPKSEHSLIFNSPAVHTVRFSTITDYGGVGPLHEEYFP